MIEIDIWLLIRLLLTLVSAVLFYKIYQFSKWNGFLFFVGCQLVNLFNRIVLLTGIIDNEPFNTISLVLTVLLTVVGAYGIYVEFKKIFEGLGKTPPISNSVLIKNLSDAENNLVDARIALRIAKKYLEDSPKEKV